MLGLSTRRSCQINKPRRWHTRRSWQGPSLLLVRMPGKSTRAICAHIATPKKTPKSTPRYCWRKRTPSWPISTHCVCNFLASRPDNFETTAIAEIINCSTLLPTVPLHIVHLATHEAVPLLRAAKAKGLPVTAETCFHYLSLCAERIGSCSTHFKCCPPIRTDDNRKLLWKALRNDVITTVVSDHSPCTPDLKGMERAISLKPGVGFRLLGLDCRYCTLKALNWTRPSGWRKLTNGVHGILLSK